jgi:tetratricopeptide (TPR) repeat protein
MTGQAIADAQSAIQQGNVGEAERILRAEVQRNPQSADAHIELGRVLTRKADHAGAADCFAQAMRIDRSRIGLALSYAVSCFRAGRYDEAEKSARFALQSEPSAPGYDALACALREQGRTAEALAAVEDAQRLEPHNSGVEHTKGTILLAMGRAADALAIFEALGSRGVVAPAIYLNRGAALEKLGRAQEAQRLYADAARLWPNFTALQRERAQRKH